MGRRRRPRGADRPVPPAGDPAAALVGRPGPDGAARSKAERITQWVLVVSRNAIGLVGLLFFGWSAASLALLYFADTLAGMGACFAAVGFRLSTADPRRGVGTVVEGALTALAVAAGLVAVVAVPLGMPLIFLLGTGSAWHALRADPTLLGAIGLIALTGLVEAVRHVFALAEGRAGEASVKQAFAILMTRWALVLMAIYTVGGALGRFGLVVVVLAYAAASVWSELEPERFAQLFPDKRRPAAS